MLCGRVNAVRRTSQRKAPASEAVSEKLPRIGITAVITSANLNSDGGVEFFADQDAEGWGSHESKHSTRHPLNCWLFDLMFPKLTSQDKYVATCQPNYN